jgi:hypothetical protein
MCAVKGRLRGMKWTPLDEDLVTSTILHHGPDVVAIWALVLASKDRYHESSLTPIACASLLRISDERARVAFEILASPDPDSRSTESEGRRIEKLDNGNWLIISGEKYQKRASKLGALEKAAERQKRHRDKAKEETKKAVATIPKICETEGCGKPMVIMYGDKALCSECAIKAGAPEATVKEGEDDA